MLCWRFENCRCSAWRWGWRIITVELAPRSAHRNGSANVKAPCVRSEHRTALEQLVPERVQNFRIHFEYIMLLGGPARADRLRSACRASHKGRFGPGALRVQVTASVRFAPATGQLDVSPLRCRYAATSKGARIAREKRPPNPPPIGLTTRSNSSRWSAFRARYNSDVRHALSELRELFSDSFRNEYKSDTHGLPPAALWASLRR
jgi:hypothetical protein